MNAAVFGLLLGLGTFGASRASGNTLEVAIYAGLAGGTFAAAFYALIALCVRANGGPR